MHRVRPCGGLSAELWPPLFCQIGFGTSTEDLPLPDATSGTCWTARIAAEKAASLTTQLLSFGRRQVLVLQVLDVNELLKELKEMLSTLPTEQVQLTMTLVSSHCRSRSTPERLSKS